MSRSSKGDAGGFGIALAGVLTCCALVTGSSGFFWIMLALVPVMLLGAGLDKRG